jgi:hypothetical protein
MTGLFDVMNQSGTGYSRVPYHGSRIVIGGSADIHHSTGYKSPDFSLYEVNDDNPLKILDNTTPTIVFEVAYTQPTRSVVLEAARHICLTRGQVQLVVAIDIIHEANTKPRKLKSVTWSHWEEDVLSYHEVKDGVVDDLRPEAPYADNEEDDDDGEDEGGSDGAEEEDGEDGETEEDVEENDKGEDDAGGDDEGDDEAVGSDEYVRPPPTAYTAVVAQPGDQKQYRMRAEQTAKWEVRTHNIFFLHH